MKVHKIELIVIDFDECGADEVKDIIQFTNYPNDCISPEVRSITTVDCGEWSDNHPLNHLDTKDAAIAELFNL